MFNIFRKSTVEDFKKESMDTYKTPVVQEPEKPSYPVYQVGKLADGRISLRVGNEYTSGTLTMNDFGARQLIRMLEAAMEESDDDMEKVNEQ